MAVIAIAVSLPAWPAAAQAPAPTDAALADARRLVEALEFERALSALDALIPQLQAAIGDGSNLAAALELRGRVHFTLGSSPAATEDFRRLLILKPAYVMSARVSPRIAALLEQTRKAVVGSVVLTIEPADAEVEVEGQRVSAGVMAMAAGEHRFSAARPGYRAATGTIPVTAGVESPFTVRLERVSAALTIVTSPPNVEVLMNGASRGETAAGPLPPELRDLPARLAVSAEAISQPMVMADLRVGIYTLQFRRPCFRPVERRLQIDAARDYVFEPVVMQPAVATLRVEAAEADAVVYIDGEPRGNAPLNLTTLCEGRHIVELRSSTGRYQERVEAEPGGTIVVKGRIRPAFALLSVAGLPEGYRGQDLRLDVERALRSTNELTLYAPELERAQTALSAEKLTNDSFSFDMAKRPQGAASKMSASVRRDLVQRVSRSLDVQGIATVTVLPGDTSLQRLAVSLLAAGGSEPDMILVDLQDQRSLLRAVETLNISPGLSRTDFGFLGLEVENVEGLVIARVDAGGAAEAAGIKVGDRLTRLAGQPVTRVRAYNAQLDAMPDAPGVAATIVDRDGVAREVKLGRARSARLVSVLDETLPFNALVAEWRARARSADNGGVMLQLNLGVGLLRIGDFDGALSVLQKIELPQGPGISRATVQYLLGVARAGAGDLAGARAAWTAASTATGAALSDEGGDPAELSRRRLKQLGG